MKQVDRDALRYWDELKQSVYNATTIDETMTQSEIERHRMQLESDPLTWFLFFFPQYAKFRCGPCAAFWHIRNGSRFEVGAASWRNPPSGCSKTFTLR